MKFKKIINNTWKFLKEDTWQSWIVSIILIIIFIKFLLFPFLSLVMGSSLPLVVVESCSMYHETNFEDWWDRNELWYEAQGITMDDFKSFSFKNGLNKGDIILVLGKDEYKKGDIIIFEAPTKHPIIHRVVSESPLSTKGDHNVNQFSIEKNIDKNKVIGKSVIKIPWIGWVKLIFFELLRPSDQRGFCR